MNDQQRMSTIVDQIRSLGGLDEDLFQRLGRELTRVRTPFGYDEQGRLKVSFFDAKSYDIESFDNRNQGRFAISYLPGPFQQRAHRRRAGSSADV